LRAKVSDPRIAVVHERFTEVAGSEHVVEQLAALWPRAAVYAALARPTVVPDGVATAITKFDASDFDPGHIRRTI
jgi:hypothetical protein